MTSHTVSSTARLSEQEAAVGFTASRQMAESLQAILVDLIELHLQGKQAHWNLVGHNFRDLHKQLDRIVDDAREASDTIAERMRSLRAVPDGRSDTVVATTTLPPFPEGELSVAAVVDLITTRLYTTAATVRRVHDGVDAEDPSTADLLHEIIDTLEKHAWMVSSENRQV
ncbi:Dps family protein [Streptomyces sp. 8L]|uniref:Dps family protein n=1 Tax=Streptomyces sp. 8L TaxID=2877242 RepID=UPI001CD7A92A|nr:DNA starvation/stationary phase protection protein [Streptomyces sp. 8L]MCA1219414.1 DNA starvation/stationary phase protection protein [Streptomyces sp. 8L]